MEQEPEPRYRAIQIDGHWFVMDRLHPDAPAEEYADQGAARFDAAMWNLIVGECS